MTNLIRNLQIFINELQSQCKTPIEKDGALIFSLKLETYATSEKLKEFLSFLNSRKDALGIQNYVTWQFPAMTVHIGVAACHVDRIRDFFHRDTTKEEVAESICFLASLGWTEEKIRELGVSRATFYRYRGAAGKNGPVVSSENQG